MKSKASNYARFAGPILRVVADPNVRRHVLDAYRWAQGSATHAGDVASAKTRQTVDEVLASAGYERARTGVAYERIGWLGAGAALATAAYLGSRIDNETAEKFADWVRTTVDELGTEARAVADNAGDVVTDASERAIEQVLDALALQRREPTSVVALRAAGWIGLGFAAGAGAFALINSGLLDSRPSQAAAPKPAAKPEPAPVKAAVKTTATAKTTAAAKTARAKKPATKKPAAKASSAKKPAAKKPAAAKPAAKPAAASPAPTPGNAA